MDETDNNEFELIQKITELAEELGWNILITKSENEGEQTPGIILGTAEFFEQIQISPEFVEEVIEFDTSITKGNKSVH